MAVSTGTEGIVVEAAALAALSIAAVVTRVLAQTEGLPVAVSGRVAIVAAVCAAHVVSEASLAVLVSLAPDAEAAALVEASAIAAGAKTDAAFYVLFFLGFLSRCGDGHTKQCQGSGESELRVNYMILWCRWQTSTQKS